MMFNNKKGQGLSMNVIIVAVIALVVLIVLVLVFTGKLKMFGQGTSGTADQFTQNCEVPGTGSECSYDETGCESRGGTFVRGPFEDCGGGDCCRM